MSRSHWCFKATAILLLTLHCLALPTLHDSAHTVSRNLGGRWYQSHDHPVHKLFKRGPTDGTDYAPVGSPEWAAGYPRGPGDVGHNLPTEWTEALNVAVQAGKIPDIPPTSASGGYPNGLNGANPEVCAASARCRADGDIWDGPDGVFWSSFDDGPQPASVALNDFLMEQNESTTHFMIGVNILYYPDIFLQSFDADHDIAVHTWTHRHMTTLSNEDLLGEFGWTMQMIHNSTGGRVPRYWRPPYGETDNRVRAIASEVFGLTTVIWNHDTADWTQDSPGPIVAAMNEFLALPKSPGLVVLNHELRDSAVQGFIRSYPEIRANGWEFRSLALIGEADGIHPYQNSAGAEAEVIPAGVLLGSQETSTTSEEPTTSTEAQTSSPSSSPPPQRDTSDNGALKDTLEIQTALLVLSGLISMIL